MASPVLHLPFSIVIIIALSHFHRVVDARANGKELCPDSSLVEGKPCLPICDLGTLNYTAIPRVSFANGTIDVAVLRPEKWFQVFEWSPCPEDSKMYSLDPKSADDIDVYRLLRNGTLYLPNDIDKIRFRGITEFCLDYASNGTYTPQVCDNAKNPTQQTRSTQPTQSTTPEYDPNIKFICSLASVPFLIATIWVYSVIPELKNTHGNTLRCYLGCLTVFFVTLATGVTQSYGGYQVVCLILGYTAYFSSIATFLWLNVMCFNMWWMFGGFGALRNNAAQRSRRNYIYYSIYAWSVPTLLTGICVCLEFIPGLEKSPFNPQFNTGICWFSNSEAVSIFFYGPLGLTIIGNVFFFVSTSIKICHLNKTNSSSNDKHHTHQNANFSLHLKLFVVMGISWTLEVMGWWLTTPELLWLCIDVINALQGIAVFVILVCKRNIWMSLKDRYGKTFSQVAHRSHRSAKEQVLDNTPSQEPYTAINKRETALSDVTNSSQLA